MNDEFILSIRIYKAWEIVQISNSPLHIKLDMALCVCNPSSLMVRFKVES